MEHTWAYCGGRFDINRVVRHSSGQKLAGSLVACVDLDNGKYVVARPLGDTHQELAGKRFDSIEQVVSAFDNSF